ncbi:cupin domain-containing protein [Umezawaea endophytica]|uniref:Cupin domain-containing protein n=1 Tax=Umezawaea endophytica TaxID=1654476 RepID=A0A9X2VKR8_9PSEU|nr:cupin domain-containing protein [Umezawaea endophytica]MCS7476978.1 cupin domain-containing protein [Umezawaea endophytica]
MSEWQTMTSVEGLPLLGGAGRFRVPARTGSGLLMEIEYPAGVASPEHSHDHDSFVYLLSGHLRGTLAGEQCELLPGQTLVHPKGVVHSVEAVETSRWLEFKAPPTLPVA